MYLGTYAEANYEKNLARENFSTDPQICFVLNVFGDFVMV